MLASAAAIDPKYGNAPEAPFMLSLYYAEQKKFQQAEATILQALSLAHNSGKTSLIQEMERHLAGYRKGQIPTTTPTGL
jgi:Tfp pilus assembly protein PilF